MNFFIECARLVHFPLLFVPKRSFELVVELSETNKKVDKSHLSVLFNISQSNFN